MFNRENKKTNTLSDDFKSVKFHTMKDDIEGKSEENKPKEESEVNNAFNKNKEASPFMSVTNDSEKKVKEAAEPKIETASKEEHKLNIPFISKAKPANEPIDIPKSEPPKNSTPALAPLNPPISKPIPTPVSAPVSSPVNNQAQQHSYPHFPDLSQSASLTNDIPEKNVDTIEDALRINSAREGKSAFFYVVIFIIILLLGAGGYYFWVVKAGNVGEINNLIMEKISNIKGDNSSEIKNDVVNDENTSINDLSGSNGEFSDKTNFLVINDADLNQNGIKTAIEKKFIEMNGSSSNLEFLAVDKNNKPISFKDFSDNFKISLSSDITNNLEMTNFSIFLYKKNNLKRVSLVISVKNKDVLKSNLLKNEKTLVSSLAPLFISDKADNVSNIQFKDSKYKDNSIRYINLNKNMDLSLDYSISGDYLILSTNKDAGRLIMDKLSDETVKNEKVFSPQNK